MKAETQTFTIYRDGEVDPSFMRRQRVESILGHTARLGQAFAHKLGECATEIFTPVMLDIHDAQNGTHLRDEYFQARRDAATAEMRERVGL